MRLPLLALCALALACRSAAPVPTRSPAGTTVPSAAGPLRLTLVGTNDLHGWVAPHVTQVPGAPSLSQGGAAAFAGYLSILRAKNPGGVVLLDAGDLFQGTLASNLTEGSVVIDVFNALGYQAVAIGNHEFDYGPVGPTSVASQPGQDPFGALTARLRQARFPMLAVNIYDGRTGQRPAWLPNDGTLLLEARGVKVGVFGLVTPTTPTTTNPVNVASLRFGSLAPEALSAAQRLRSRGAEVVVAVAHAGGKCQSLKDPNDLGACDVASGEVFEMLAGLPAGTLDAVIAGHTHAPIGHFVNGTPVIETYGLGRAFGMIELRLDPVTRKVLAPQTRITPAIPICEQVDAATQTCEPKKVTDAAGPRVQARFLGEPVVPDVALTALIAPVLAQVEAQQRQLLGLTVPVALTRNYEAESPLGDFLADSLRAMEGADVALLNSGGLRADLASGPVTYGAIYEILPFDNSIATLTMSGEELRRLLQAAYGSRKGVFQQAGLRVRLAACPGPDRLLEVALASGKPLVAARRYKVVLPDFLARGGDGLGPVIGALPPGQVDLGDARPINFRDAIIAYWQRRAEPLAAPFPGRTTLAPSTGSCGREGGGDLQP